MKKRKLLLLIIFIASLTFCEDIMESVKEYNSIFEIISVSPSANSVNVPITTLISARFSRDVNFSTVDGTTFSVNGGAVTGVLSYNPSSESVIFTPDSDLLHNTIYTVDITAGIRDIDGTYLPSGRTWSFTTVEYYFNVLSVYPSGGAVNVPVNTVITAQFDDNIDLSSVDTTTFNVNDGGGAVAGVYTIDPTLRIVTFTPSAALNGTTLHTVTLTTGILNTSGESMASDYTWSFTTGAAAIPEIYIVSPLSADFISGDTFDLGSVTTPYTFTLGNSGNGALNLTSVTLSDMVNFATSLIAPAVINAGTSTTFTVTFTPGTTGVKNASLLIYSDDVDETPFIINLTAVQPLAPVPEIQVMWNGAILTNNTSTVDFGTLAIGATGTQTIIIYNIGTDDLNITGTTFGGTNPAYFSTAFSTATIVAGGTANVIIDFSAPIKINARATIIFANNDSDEAPFTVKLKGRTMP